MKIHLQLIQAVYIAVALLSLGPVQKGMAKNNARLSGFSFQGQETDTTSVQGTVVDENGVPVAGTIVKLKGSAEGTSTDNDGKFALVRVKEGEVLLIRHLGYQPAEVKIDKQRMIVIRLQPAINELTGVTVSTGYQQLPQERATGSFAQIDNKTLNQQTGSNIINRMDGVTSGVLFPKQKLLANAPSFMVRGLSSINGPKNPLIIVDNFPYDGDINNIDPNDVESITVLKDAAAASIWGTRAGNGVVVITTKKGKYSQPLQVDFNMNFSVTGKPDLASLRMLSSSDYIDVEQMLFSHGFYNSYLRNRRTFPAVSPIIEILNLQKNGLISSEDATAQIDAYRKISLPDQYEKYMYQKATLQQYAINLHGGSEKTSYYLSAGYDGNTNELAAVNRRLTIRSENSYRPLKNLRLTAGIQYTQVNNQSGKPAYSQLKINNGKWQIPYLPLADNNRNPLPIATQYRQTFADTVGGGKLLNWEYYPLEDWKHNTTSVNQQDITATLGLNYQIIKGLSADIKYQYEKQNGVSRNLKDIQSYAARDMINTFTQVNPTTGVVTHIVPMGGILNVSNNILESSDGRAQLNYNQIWKKHEVAAIAGAEIHEQHTTGNSSAYYGYNPDNLSFSHVDYVNGHPNFVTGGLGYLSDGLFLSDQVNRYVSFYGNASYTYNNRYTVSVSGRRDGSNAFGVATNDKWNPLWSAGGSWQVSNEPFYHIGWLPYLRLRATYGFSGNTDPYRAAVTTLLAAGSASYSNYPQTRVDQYGNPYLKWEKVRMINMGIDFQTINDRLSGSLEAYLKRGSDLFGPYPYDPTDGLNLVGTLTRNVASMKGQGVDITLNSKNITGAFSWNSSLLLSYTMSKTASYYDDTTRLADSYINNGGAISPLSGKPLYAIVAYPWAGLDGNGDPQGYVDGKLSTDYATITLNTPKTGLVYRPALPVVFGSLINTFAYEEISLIINTSFEIGNYFMKPSFTYSDLYSGGEAAGTADYTKRWRKPGDEKITNVPASQYPADDNRDFFYGSSTALIDRADNIRIKYIDLSYDLGEILVKKGYFKNLRIYVSGSNLGIIWRANKDGIDPDYVAAPTPGSTYTFGIRASF